MITQERLKELLNYDVKTGEFSWTAGTRARPNGKKCTYRNDSGYVCIRVDGKHYRAHRLAWLYVFGKNPVGEIDHINGVRDDNRIENLREVTRSENKKNQGRTVNNKSGHNGVRWYAPLEKWHVQICCNRKKSHIGYFDSLEDAIIARKEAERDLNFHKNHGERDSWRK